MKKDIFSKRETNRQATIKVGRTNKELTIASLNSFFVKSGGEIKLDFVHKSQRVLSTLESMQNNKLLNRITDVSLDKNMGLSVELTSEKNSKRIVLEIRNWTDPDLFIKKPTDVKLPDYIKSILQYSYFLIIDPQIESYHLISIKDLLKFSTPLLQTSEENRNRICFYYGGKNKIVKPKDFTPILVFKGGDSFFGSDPNLYEALKKIIK